MNHLLFYGKENQISPTYSFLNFFIFLSLQFSDIKKKIIFLFSWTERHTKLKLDTHMGKRLIYCVHQKQAARMYLFLYFSYFFLSLQLAKIKTLLLQIVSTYLWWLRPGVCELCSLSAIFRTGKPWKVMLISMCNFHILVCLSAPFYATLPFI